MIHFSVAQMVEQPVETRWSAVRFCPLEPKYSMREWMKLFEDDLADHDAAEDERLSGVYERERVVEAHVAAICKAVGLTSFSAGRAILYQEEMDRTCVIKLDEAVTLSQLEAFKEIADNVAVMGNHDYGVVLTLTIR